MNGTATRPRGGRLDNASHPYARTRGPFGAARHLKTRVPHTTPHLKKARCSLLADATLQHSEKRAECAAFLVRPAKHGLGAPQDSTPPRAREAGRGGGQPRAGKQRGTPNARA